MDPQSLGYLLSGCALLSFTTAILVTKKATSLLPQGLGFGPVERAVGGNPDSRVECIVLWRGQRVGVLTRYEHGDMDSSGSKLGPMHAGTAAMLHAKGAVSYTITGTITHGSMPFFGLCPHLLLTRFAAELVAWELLGRPDPAQGRLQAIWMAPNP